LVVVTLDKSTKQVRKSKKGCDARKLVARNQATSSFNSLQINPQNWR